MKYFVGILSNKVIIAIVDNTRSFTHLKKVHPLIT